MPFAAKFVAALLSFSLASGFTPGLAAPAVPGDRQGPSPAALSQDERILHALNRFTFGPRPGDLEAVRAIGLNRWFEQQLHPERIDNSSLDKRLAQFPAMQATPEELLRRLPSNAVIRQAVDGKVQIPQDAFTGAVYRNQMARVTAKKQEQQAASTMAPMVADAPGPDVAQPAPPAQTILSLPPSERIDRLVSLSQPQLDAFLKSLKGPQRVALTADLTPEMKEKVAALENPERVVVDELMSQRLTRDVYSSAQLQEVMTDFWLNHFNVFLRKNEAMPYYLVSYERDVIRPRSLGKFEDLLEATAHNPAMLLYLDNGASTGPDSVFAAKAKAASERNPARNKKPAEGLNENYARELMELHTVGVNGGYTQADVIQAARILTGWTVDRPQRGGQFKFDENRHEPGTKKVLGRNFKEQGEKEGRDLLHLLATRPATAQFLSRELAVRFVSDNPPQRLVDRMAKSYRSSGGDIAAVLKTMFHSPEFWSANLYRAKVKTPLEYVVSAVRASGANVLNTQPLVAVLREMGMPLYGCVPPTGYKWDSADWISTGALVSRMNFALALAGSRLNGIAVSWAAPYDPSSGAPGTQVPSTAAEETRLESLLIGGGVSSSTRGAVLQQFQQQSAPNEASARPASLRQSGRNRVPPANVIERQDQLLAGLLMGSPEFQRR